LLRNTFHRVTKPRVPVVNAVPPLDFAVKAPGERAILKLTNLHKHFGGLKAVDGIDIEVAHGTVHALIGPNGSGKTTSLNVVNGIYRPTAGSIMLDGVDVTQMKPHARAGLGMGRTFQNIRLFSTMTAVENVMVGGQRDNNPIQAGREALVARALSAL